MLGVERLVTASTQQFQVVVTDFWLFKSYQNNNLSAVFAIQLCYYESGSLVIDK